MKRIKKIIIYSFLTVNLIASEARCTGASAWFSSWFETEEQKLNRIAKIILQVGDNISPLALTETREEYTKTKSHKPIKTVRRHNTAQISLLATAIKENSLHKEIVSMKTIPEKDGRDLVKETDTWPYSVHGTVFMTFPSTKSDTYQWGSGTLIASNLVLTAAHNLYNHEKREEIREVRFCPAVNGKALPFDEPKVIKYYFPKDYKDKDDFSLDYGILVLDHPIGNKTGYFGLGVISEPYLKTKTINITGYPEDKVQNKDRHYEMWTMAGPVKEVKNGMIHYEIDTYDGQSGGGVWYQEGENCFVCGVHVAGDKQLGINYAVLLTQGRYDQIKEWIKDSIPKTIDRNLRDELFDNVTKISFVHQYMDNKGAQLFTSERLPNLTILDLSYNDINDVGIQALAQNTNLLSLNLTANRIRDIEASFLAQNSTLVKLILDINKIGDAGADFLSQNTTLLSLSLQWNNISNIGVQSLAHNQTLIQLYLGINNISDKGAEFLAQNTTLRELCLWWNNIGDVGAWSLAQNTTLKELQLAGNRIYEEGKQALAQNTTLVYLNLNARNIDVIGTATAVFLRKVIPTTH